MSSNESYHGQPPSEISSIERVFNTTEIMEMALSYLGMADLHRCKSVSLHWYRLIRDSSVLQHAYYCTASAPDSHVYVQYEEETHAEYQSYCVYSWTDIDMTVSVAGDTNEILWNHLVKDMDLGIRSRNLLDLFSKDRIPEWKLLRQSLLCDPPAKDAVIITEQNPGGYVDREIIRLGGQDHDGLLTLGDILDKVKEWKDLRRPWEPRATILLDGERRYHRQVHS